MNGIEKKVISIRMGKKFNPLVEILLYWYLFVFISTEIFSYFNIFNRTAILISSFIFFSLILKFYKKSIFDHLRNINWKSRDLIIIYVLLILLFIQGFMSAPSTTDSMVYHLPRVMYWMQEKTVFQDIIRNDHDFMPPFAEYILAQFYIIAESDRFLFLAQWLAYLMSIYLTGLIVVELGANNRVKRFSRLAIAALPIAVMQASSTQTDMSVAVFVLLSLYLSFYILNDSSFKNLFLFGVSLGLGSLVKTTFIIFATIPIGFLFLKLINKGLFLKAALVSISLVICLTIQIPYFSQNIRLYGNLFGTQLINQNSVYTNEMISPNVLISNLIRNILVNTPLPFINNNVQQIVDQIHKGLNLSVNDSRTTYEDSVFRISQVLYPQEDIIGNPLHLLLILIAGLYSFAYFKRNKFDNTILLFILSISSFIFFSGSLKWQQQHPRLEIPFFIVGTVTSVKILMINKIGEKIVKVFLFVSLTLALILIFLNIARPYISYKPFYNYVQGFAPALSVVPESFLIRQRDEQYFNARFYWFQPFVEISRILSKEKGIKFVSFQFMDNFEYPLWVILKEQGNEINVIPIKEYWRSQYLITTSQEEYKKKGYVTFCKKTSIEYGYACLSKKII